jgi:type I restriction enzyme S subunit
MTDDLANGWKLYKVSDFAEVVGGGTPNTQDSTNFGEDVPWVTPKDLSTHQSRFIARGERSLSTKGLSGSSAKRLPAGTVLVSSRAPIGLTAIAQNEVSTNQGCRSLVLNSDLADSEFIYYLMSASTDYLHQHANGTTFMELSGGVFKNLEFLLPPLNDQRRIAEVLGTLDDRIESLDRAERLLLNYGLTQLEIAIEAGDSHSMRVDEVATFENRKRIPLSQMERDGRPGPYPYYGATAIFGYVDDYLFDGFRVLVGEDGSVIEDDGTPVLQLVQGKYWVNNHAHVLAGRAVSTEALWFLLRNLAVDPAVTGAVQPKLSMGRLAALEVLVPSEASPFFTVAKECIAQVLHRREQLRHMVEARDFLLPRLVSGELRVAAAEKLVEAAT